MRGGLAARGWARAMGVFFDRAGPLAAFDAVRAAARDHGARLDVAVHGGAALMLASDVRFATEDVGIAEIGTPWPGWLSAAVRDIARRDGWSEDRLNDAVAFHLSSQADRAADHVEFGSHPRAGAAGLTVLVPSAEHMLSLKLQAMRIIDPFHAAPAPAARAAMLADGPPVFDDPRLDALIGGAAEYLLKCWAPDAPPRWIGAPSRSLDEPFFLDAGHDPGLPEYLTFAGPGEFKSRNVMVDDEPLRRANTPRP